MKLVNHVDCVVRRRRWRFLVAWWSWWWGRCGGVVSVVSCLRLREDVNRGFQFRNCPGLKSWEHHQCMRLNISGPCLGVHWLGYDAWWARRWGTLTRILWWCCVQAVKDWFSMLSHCFHQGSENCPQCEVVVVVVVMMRVECTIFAILDNGMSMLALSWALSIESIIVVVGDRWRCCFPVSLDQVGDELNICCLQASFGWQGWHWLKGQASVMALVQFSDGSCTICSWCCWRHSCCCSRRS